MMRNRVHFYGSVFYAYLLVGAQYDTFIFFPCKIDLERSFYQAGSHIVVFSVAAMLNCVPNTFVSMPCDETMNGLCLS